MQVFKLYYKILLRGLIVPVILYVIIFSILTIVFTKTGSETTDNIFKMEKCITAVIDNDNSELSTQLDNYIRSNTRYVKINDTSEEGLKDALFFRQVECIYFIPKGYEKSLFTDKRMELQSMRIPNSTSGELVDTVINKFINTFELYIKSGESITIDSAIQSTIKSLNENTSIVIANEDKSSNVPAFAYYYNYLPYPIISILVLCVAGISLIINTLDIKRRNICAPISVGKFNFALFLGNLSISVILYFIFVVYSVIIYNNSVFSANGLWIMLNGFIFTAVCLSLCFLIANIASKKSVSAISTVLSLAACFLGGVFVPQELLSEAVKNVAVINPVFWYVKANNILGSISTFNFDTLKPVFYSMIVEICFAAVFLSIALVVAKQKRTSEQ